MTGKGGERRGEAGEGEGQEEEMGLVNKQQFEKLCLLSSFSTYES